MIPAGSSPFAFSVVPGKVVHQLVSDHRTECMDIVRDAYLAHDAGRSVNPNSLFLRFPDKPSARIIALPAHLGEPWSLSGIKWISSFPENIQHGLPRASAVLVLNDHQTGYPFACLEASIISAARTAASAWVAARAVGVGRSPIHRLGIVGNGLIARYVFDFLLATGIEVRSVALFDLDQGESTRFAYQVCSPTHEGQITVCDDAASLVSGSDVVVLTTTAARPYLTDSGMFRHHPVVLNLSLRDVAPELLLEANNVVDDVDHVLNADTSPHLAEQLCGHRDFIDGTIADAIEGRCRLEPTRTTFVSPFGLGVLDLAVGSWVHHRARASGELVRIDDFFSDLAR